MSWLYRYEAKSIQSWILATDRLRELAGGSALIERLAAAFEEALEGGRGKFLYAGAGGGTATFDDEGSLRAFAGAWPMYVAQVAPGLELVQAWSASGDLGEVRRRLGAARNRALPDLPEAGPWVARAGRTGLAATRRDPKDKSLLDRGTHARATEGRDPLLDMLRDGLRDFPDVPSEVEVCADIQRYPNDEGVAVVHADGNGIGRLIAGKSPSELQAFSTSLTDASKRAARTAFAGLVRMERDSAGDGPLTVHGRPIVAGGDDFTFLVRGRAGIALAECWLREFEASGLTACAGVAFVRRGSPFYRAYEIAEGLCAAAKRDHRREGGSRLAFERVTTALYDASEDAGGRSWSLAELRLLSALADAARRLDSRGALRAWAAERDAKLAKERRDRLLEVADEGPRAALLAALEPFEQREQVAVRAALQWLRVQPGRDARLWGAA